MYSESFADMMLNERKLSEKMKILLYFKKKHNCFFDTTVIFKTEICRMYLEHSKPDVDNNLVLTACLLYACKKSVISFTEEKRRTYLHEGAKYLEELGFDERFCRICEQINRYSGSEPREPEADILELIDQFGGMLLDRPERIGFQVDEALVLLEYRNLKGKNNRYLQIFKDFVNRMEAIKV